MAMVNPHVSPALGALGNTVGALGAPLVSHAAVVGESGGGVPVKQRLGPVSAIWDCFLVLCMFLPPTETINLDQLDV